MPPIHTLVDKLMALPPARLGARLTPCLVGQTGSGKTALVRQIAAGRTLQVVLLGSMLPEDVLGLPRVRAGRTVWSLPTWAEAEVVFLDELDKARPEVIGTVLTFLASREIHGQPFPGQVVAAMQPVDRDQFLADETGRALAARLIFLPMRGALRELGACYRVNPELLAQLPDPPVSLPVLPAPVPRQVDWYLSMRGVLSAEEAELVRSGLVTREWADWLEALAESRHVSALSADELAQAIRRDPLGVVEAAPLPELAVIAPYVWLHGTAQAVTRMVERIATGGGPELLQGMATTVHERLLAIAEANGGSVDVLPGDTDESVYAAFYELAKRVKASQP